MAVPRRHSDSLPREVLSWAACGDSTVISNKRQRLLGVVSDSFSMSDFRKNWATAPPPFLQMSIAADRRTVEVHSLTSNSMVGTISILRPATHGSGPHRQRLERGFLMPSGRRLRGPGPNFGPWCLGRGVMKNQTVLIKIPHSQQNAPDFPEQTTRYAPDTLPRHIPCVPFPMNTDSRRPS